MIVDTSALIAILQGEVDALQFAERLSRAEASFMTAPSYLETCMVYCARRGPNSKEDIEALTLEAKIHILPFSSTAAEIAVNAILKYGKGRSNPAQLNFGDCMSYAASKIEMMPLLFKGDDFRHTDVEAAL